MCCSHLKYTTVLLSHLNVIAGSKSHTCEKILLNILISSPPLKSHFAAFGGVTVCWSFSSLLQEYLFNIYIY